MAEVLGIADSVKGLTTIADAIVRKGFRYMKDVKDAEKTVEKLVEEVNNLSGVLHSLNNVVERLEEDDPDVDPATQIHYIESCYKTLKKIQDLFDEAVPTAPLSKRDRLKWPLKKEHTKELLVEIGRHKATMILAMTAREMGTLLQILAGQDEIRKGLQEIKLSIEADRAERQRMIISDERQKMLQLLGRDIDPRKWQDSNTQLRQPGTGVWFTDGTEFRAWLSTDASKLWVNGIPGAGKTILISSVIQEIEKGVESSHALAFFYCDYKDPETHYPSTILGSLAKQLVLQDERCYAELGEFCLDHTTGYGSVRVPTPEEVAELIRKISKHFQTTMIIVDGLDEITNDRAYVTRLLRDLNTEGGHIKTLFASRPEVDIGYELEDFVQISIAAMSSDIRLYVASEIERRTREKRWRIRDPSLKDHIMKTLVDEADGMFRWVSCQMDYLCECNNDRDRREALKKLRPDLPSSYERILERANRSSKENQDLVKKTLHWIVYAKDPLDTEELIEALAVCDGDRSFDSTSMTTEEDILHWCSSLVRRNPSSGELELAHFTVEEFLAAIDPVKKPAFQKYRLSGDHTLLAKACLDFILCEDFDGFALPKRGNSLDDWLDESFEITNNHPFGKYAYVRWMYHVHNSKWDNIKTEVMDLFDTNSAIEFWMLCWLRAQTHSTRVEFDFDQSGAKFFEPASSPTALHWAAAFALDKACALLLEDGMSVSQQSAMGTPLFCAIVSDYAISKSFTIHDPDSDLWQKDSRELTIERLLDTGADLNETVDPESKARAFAIAIRCERRSLDTAFIASMLLDAGARIFKNDFRILHLDHDNRRLRPGPLPAPLGPPGFLHHGPLQLDPIKPATTKVCGIPAESIFVSVTIDSWKRLVPGTECGFFSFALNLIACGWPQETFRSFFCIKFADLFADSNGAELDRILSGDTTDWQCILVDVLSKAIRISAPTAAQASSSLQQCLHDAVNSRNVTVVSHLLSCNDDIDLSHQNEESGETLLHVAMRVRCDSAPLISHGADVLCPDYTGLTPIQLAAVVCGLDKFQLFWDSAIKSNSLGITHGIIRALTNAATRRNRPVMSFLVHQLLQRKMIKVDYLLELALGLGIVNSPILEVLLSPDHGISSVLEKADGEEKKNCYVDGNGEMVVAVEGDGEEEESFEGNGRQGAESRKHFSASEEKPRNTAFELEALYLATNPDVSYHTFDYLFSRLYRDHPYHRYQSGNTIMHILASNDDEKSLAKLRYYLGLDLDPSILNDAGLTPLAVSIQYQTTAVMELLLQEGANPDFPLRNGQTALHLACELDNWIAAKCLLAYDCQTWLRDHQGRTAADIAWSKGYLDFATLVWNARCMTSQRPRLAYVRTGRVRRRSWVHVESRSSSRSSYRTYASSDRSLVSD
ncbi:hypothetical protein L207DRAFT_592050 [Hyaloscypha variabilis F]|uniref:NACHT domain-containing protein n=1 Tax=Hyaloscypha variabilis (strain UAMH 11265 / GT02V1 / F) TaxID=1149755 RepID=A0A2J6QXW6_HYAVF|nr:hypothetical protein L207DRAFT_592050 [Hyaloscypha variabilis F]